MRGKSVAWAAVTLVLAAQSGCAEVSRVVGSTWHEKCGWKAEDYFNDPQVIALCQAIEGNDIAEIDRLIAAGADVNAQGKGKMTPLLWAFPDNKLERFKRLLEHGADPNVIIESEFNTRGGMSSGDSVTHMAAGTLFPGYFKAVFEHGGDPNLVSTSRIKSKDTPLFTLITGSAQNKKEKIQLLIDMGVDLNHLNGIGITPTMQAAGRGYYDIALMLLEAGADPRIYQANQMMKLVHVVVRQETRLPHCTPKQRTDYERLVEWLKKRGESLEEARADEERWRSWGAYGLEKKAQLMEAEKKTRLAREARDKAAAEQVDQHDE